MDWARRGVRLNVPTRGRTARNGGIILAIAKALRGAKRPHPLSQALGAWLNRLPNLEERFKTRKLGLQYSANL
jgi:hypothetical protein